MHSELLLKNQQGMHSCQCFAISNVVCFCFCVSFFSSARVGPECSYDLRHLWSRQLRLDAWLGTLAELPLLQCLASTAIHALTLLIVSCMNDET